MYAYHRLEGDARKPEERHSVPETDVSYLQNFLVLLLLILYNVAHCYYFLRESVMHDIELSCIKEMQ